MKVEFYSFWDGFNKDTLYFEDLFNDYKDIYDTLQVWSVFGPEPKSINTNPRILSIQLSGEPFYKDVNKYNINFISKNPEFNVIPMLFAAYEIRINNNLHKLTEERIEHQIPKTRFCNFIASNNQPTERTHFFLELSKHKFVDSCGGVFRNWTGPPAPPVSSNEYHDFLHKWRFMICFENRKVDYYLTEKIVNAYMGGCIPIYWGCPQIIEKNIFNKKAILLLEDNTPESVTKLINRIMELENSPELYSQMHKEPLFINNEIAKEFTIEYMKEQIKLKLA